MRDLNLPRAVGHQQADLRTRCGGSVEPGEHSTFVDDPNAIGKAQNLVAELRWHIERLLELKLGLDTAE
jgi:hypothetical protein